MEAQRAEPTSNTEKLKNPKTSKISSFALRASHILTDIILIAKSQAGIVISLIKKKQKKNPQLLFLFVVKLSIKVTIFNYIQLSTYIYIVMQQISRNLSSCQIETLNRLNNNCNYSHFM